MLERTDVITKEVLEPITFVLAFPTVFPYMNLKYRARRRGARGIEPYAEDRSQ